MPTGLAAKDIDWRCNCRDSAPEGKAVFRVHEAGKPSGTKKERVAFVSFKTIAEVVECFASKGGAANRSELSLHEVYNPLTRDGVKLFADVEKTRSSDYSLADVEEFARLITNVLDISYKRATGEDPEAVTIYSSSRGNKLSLHGVVTGRYLFASPDDIGRVVGSGVVACEQTFPGTIDRLVWYDEQTSTHKFVIDFKCVNSLRLLYSVTVKGERRKMVFMRNRQLVPPQQPKVRDADVAAYLPESLVFSPEQGEVLQGLPDSVAMDSNGLLKALRERRYPIIIAYANTCALTPATAAINKSRARNDGVHSTAIITQLRDTDGARTVGDFGSAQLLQQIAEKVIEYHCKQHPAFGAAAHLEQGAPALTVRATKMDLPGGSHRGPMSHGYTLHFQAETNSRYCERRYCEKHGTFGSAHGTRTLGFEIEVSLAGVYRYRTMCPSTNHGQSRKRGREDTASYAQWRKLDEGAELYIYSRLSMYHNNGRGRVL